MGARTESAGNVLEHGSPPTGVPWAEKRSRSRSPPLRSGPLASDRELLGAWRDGDQSSGSALFQRHFKSLRRFFRTKVPINDVEDLIQRTLMSCLESVANFRGDAKFQTYLFTIARRELYAYIRRKTRDKIADGLDETVSSIRDLGMSPSRAALALQEHQLIAEAMQTLPVDFQVTLELYYWEQLRGPELATVLQISPATVRTRLHRAREALRSSLERLRSEEVEEAELEESVHGIGKAL